MITSSSRARVAATKSKERGALFLLPVALGLVVPAGLDPLMRHETLAHPGEKDPLELQPLEAVQRADAHGVRLRRDVPADLAGADAVLLIGEGDGHLGDRVSRRDTECHRRRGHAGACVSGDESPGPG
nr:hypothetical protein [Streptomyces tendae]